MVGNALKIINYLYQYLKDDTKIFEIKEHKNRRSKSQNSYAWELISKLADYMRIPKDEMYLKMLEEYGQSILIPVETGKRPDGYFKYYAFYDKSVINGKTADWYKVYKGSSEFDSKEMSIFIDGLIQECSNLEIPTLTKEQIEEMKLY